MTCEDWRKRSYSAIEDAEMKKNEIRDLNLIVQEEERKNWRFYGLELGIKYKMGWNNVTSP